MKAPYTLTLGDADCRIEISVRFTRAQAPTSIAISGSMTPQAVPSVVPPHDGAAVLGRIDAPATRLESLIESWIQHMQARNCAPGTVASWPRLVRGVCKEAGWTQPEHVEYAAVSAHCAAKQQRKEWGPATVRSVLSALKSLDRHRRQLEAGDIQAIEGPLGIEIGQGARAATTDEARLMLRTARSRELNDGRARSARTLYGLCLFAGGCREDEPSLWVWSDLRLDSKVPHIIWRPDMHKNRRTMVVAIAPELAEQLRAHRSEVPCGAQDPVFPRKPPRDVWMRDRDRAGIPSVDDRGRVFTPHSARKWLFTSLTVGGVPTAMAEHLIRHTHSVRGVYNDPPLEAQALALACIPAIWPRADEISTMKRARKKNEIKRLTSMDDAGHDYSVKAKRTCTSPATSRPPALVPPSGACAALTTATDERRGSSCCTSGAPALPTLDSDQRFEPESGRYHPESAHLKMGATARLLRALADLIESGRAAPSEGTVDELRNAGRVA